MDPFLYLTTTPLAYWHWLAIGFLLMALELILPGVFLLWIGLAAVIVGVVAGIFGLEVLAAQLAVFAVLVLSIVVGVRKYRDKIMGKPSDQPTLNDRTAALIGKEYVATEALINGRGRLKIGDSWWSAETTAAETLPAETRVKIIKAESGVLVVEKVQKTLIKYNIN